MVKTPNTIMKKLFRNIHLWLSLPLGILISIICLSGAALVFEQDITQALQRSIYRVTPPQKGAEALSPEAKRRTRYTLPPSNFPIIPKKRLLPLFEKLERSGSAFILIQVKHWAGLKRIPSSKPCVSCTDGLWTLRLRKVRSR